MFHAKHPTTPSARAVGILALLLSAGPLVLVSSAHAQGVAVQDAGDAVSEQTLESIVITAQRREQAAQDTGVALSVLPGERLADQGVTQVNQLVNHTPSLEIEPAFGGGQPQFRIRGVGFQDYASNNSSTVGVYLDDVAQPLPIGTQGQLFDLERVEVLRGPQGTLYGRNSTGGAINFLVARPTEEFRAGANLSLGSHSAFDGQGYVSGTLAPGLRGRLSVAATQGGDWQRNRITGEDFGEKDRLALRGQLEWDATDRLNFRLVVNTGRDKSDANGLYLFRPSTTALHGVIPADTNHDNTGWGVRPGFAQAIGENFDKPGRDNTNNNVALHANADLGFANLTSITAYSKLKRREYNDWDASIASESDVFFRSDAKVFSQELRLASRQDGKSPLDWVGGLYYSHEELDEEFFSDFHDLNWGFSGINTTYKQKAETVGLFGQIGYAFTERARLIAGLRYEDETRKLRDFVSLNIDTNTPLGNAPLAGRSTSLGEFSGKLGLEYRLTPDALLYAHVSRGVKSGGFTAYNGSDPDRIEPFDKESVLAYELGFKSDLSRSLRLNGAAFFYDYRDQQVLSAHLGERGLVGRIVNAPKSEIYGGELELEWLPARGLTIRQGLGYKEGEYKEFQALDVAATQATGLTEAVYRDLKGTKLNFPNISYIGGITYRWDTGGWRFTADADYSYRDKYNSWLGQAYDIKGYWLANARLEISPKGAPWAIAIWGRNIFDKEYDVTRNFFVNAQVALAGQPRSFGVQFKYDY